MNMTEKNGQPSMEEILASIRRIIAEEPASQAHGDVRGDFRGGQPIMLKGDGVLDDAGDFDLPAIFRSSSTASAPDRPAPLLGRLTDAIRSATTAQPDGHANGEDLAHADALEVNGAAAEPIQDYSLSSLQPVRPNGHHINGQRPNGSAALNGARPANGSAGLNGHGLNGHGHHAERSEPAPASLSAASSSGGDEPKRVMASFKDTKFMQMSAPAPASPETTSASAPPVEAPVVEPLAPAPVFEVEEVVAAPVPDPIETAEVPSPVVMMPPPPLPAAAAPGDGSESVGSIEDTTADLLRPMLRQWLADNMPRMVEKALHIEIAESVKPIKKP